MLKLAGSNIMAIVLFLVSAGLGYIYIYPAYTEITVLREKENRYEDVLRKASDFRILRNKLLANYDSVSIGKKIRLAKVLPDKIDEVELVRDIYGLASSFGIKVEGFSIEKSGGEGNANNLPADIVEGPSVVARQAKPVDMKIDFNAPYPTFILFLEELEKNLQLTEVTAMSIGSGGEEKSDEKTKNGKDSVAPKSDTVVHSYSLSLRFYKMQD